MITALLADKAEYLLSHESTTINKDQLHLPGPDFVDRIWINSGGASFGDSDLQEAVTTGVVNKRAGGMGLISVRKAFQRPMKEGVAILNAIQDVYLDNDITIA